MQLQFLELSLSDTTARAVCWTLVHCLWEGLLIAVLAGLIIICTRKLPVQKGGASSSARRDDASGDRYSLNQKGTGCGCWQYTTMLSRDFLILVTIALLTVSFYAIRAALANPVKSFRSE